MRRLRRRRPAGIAQVPIPFGAPQAATPVGESAPAVVRIGPDRTLLDPPWEMAGCAVAHIWPDARVTCGWARVAWPVDPWSSRPVAPLDLHLGHVLEFSLVGAHPVVRYAIVADRDEARMILVPAASPGDAVSIARRLVDVWRAAELARTEDIWRERIARALKSRNSAP